MSVLILQIIIKQWDKSQRSEVHVSMRNNIADSYRVISPPAVYAFDHQCIVDMHGDDRLGNRVKYAQTTEGTVKIDRFQITSNNNILEYCDTSKSDAEFKTIGLLEDNWIQCKYHWRYSIFEDDMFYWLYEDVTLNAIYTASFNENIFLNAEPALKYEDL